MVEYSKDYSKSVAFDPSTYPDGSEFGTKLIKVGEDSYWYDPSREDEHSALPKKDIEAMIEAGTTGLSEEVTFVTDVTIINGLVKKRTRTAVFEDGVLKTVSTETPWS
jgi:hypothetical protein